MVEDAEPVEPVEIEIKLSGPSAMLKQAFCSLQGQGAKTSHVVSVYHDTSDDRIWRKGYTLRLRAKGNAYELTLKSEGGNTLRRGEWSSMLHEPIPDPGLLPDGAPRSGLGLILPEEVIERHRTDVKRTKSMIEVDGAQIEASLDLGEIRSGGTGMPVGELELELVHGDPVAILVAADRLLAGFPLALEGRSKAARGMELALARPPLWRKAAKPQLSAGDSVDTAIARILETTASQMLANIAAAADGRDPEGVHQLRVSLRRLRSAFSIFGVRIGDEIEALNEQAGRILRSLGPARDIDVFINETLPPVIGEHEGARGLAQLGACAGQRLSSAYDDVRRLLGGAEFSRFVVRVLLAADRIGARQRPDMTLHELADSVLNKRRKKVLKKGEGFETMPTVQRHEVRIALKKFRYAVDFFQSLYPEDAVLPFQTLVKDLQDDFGAMNDASVAGDLAEQLADGQVEAMLGAFLIRGWYAHRLKAVEPHMIGAWQQFREARPFWKT